MANQPAGRNKPELRKTNEYSPSQVPEPNKTKKRKTDTKYLKTNARGRVDRTNLVHIVSLPPLISVFMGSMENREPSHVHKELKLLYI